MRTLLAGPSAGLLVLTAVMAASPAPTSGLTVLRAEVRFARAGAASGVPAGLRLEGDFDSGLAGASFDPVRDGFRVEIGGVVALDAAAADAAVRARRLPRGEWVGRARSGDGVRARFRLWPASGAFSVRARGLDGSVLLAAGSGSVALEVLAGGESRSAAVEFFEPDPRSWTYRMDPPDRRPAPETGPPSPPPLPPSGNEDYFDLTLFPIAKGTSSRILSQYKRVVRDDSEWADLWHQHAPLKPVPFVDFTRRMVVAYVGGVENPTDRVSIRSVQKIGNSLRVWAGPEGSDYGGMKDSPYHFVSVQRYNVPDYFFIF